MLIVLFWILSGLAVLAAIGTVTRRNPLSAALSLVICLTAVAGLFAVLEAHFLFAIQLLVYAGAIMVLVLYVIMLLNLKERETRPLGVSRPRAAFAGIAAALVLAVLARVWGSLAASPPAPPEKGFGTVESMAGVLFTKYPFPFEVISILLLAAVVGAVVLAMRKF
ncbi:MAG: NADH-quinone oxidoreductase subunit J [Candidatus Eisenbacteria bacterium]|nr:NADH-quinone oxidoreductase subunit J [Candidatus Eisenbacteria bacterium]